MQKLQSAKSIKKIEEAKALLLRIKPEDEVIKTIASYESRLYSTAYQKAVELERKGSLQDAVGAFMSIRDYKDSELRAQQCMARIQEEKQAKNARWELEMCKKNTGRISSELEGIKEDLEHTNPDVQNIERWEKLIARARKEWNNLFKIYGEACSMWDVEAFIKDCELKKRNCMQACTRMQISWSISQI